MSLHKLTAGSGYTYLTRQVAAHDRVSGDRSSLASYYSEKGETPGRWVGSGMAGIDGLNVGDEVTAAQMRALFGAGLHPLAEQRRERLEGPELTDRDFKAVTRLGEPFKVYTAEASTFQVQVAKRIEDHNAELGHPRDYPVQPDVRARIRTEVATELFRSEHGRDPRDARELSGAIAKLSRPRTTAVGGFDLTFSPVKSVSTLWAVAPPQVAAQVELAHNEAVTDALAFIEKHALYSREGTDGVRQVDVTGLVAAAFTHRDSRAGDPDLHTHVAVANKVQTLSGKWLSIDGRVLFKAKVTASETYNTALEKHLRTRLGLVFAERPGSERGKRPIREVVGVDPALNRRWSTRRASIEVRRGELATTFQRDHGRPPTVVEAIMLAQQATLETRDAKHEPRTLTEQRAAWRKQAEQVLDGPRGVEFMVANALSAGRSTPTGTVDAAWVRDTATRVRDELQARRSTWQVWHVRAEAHRQVRAANLPAEHVDTIVDLVTDHTLNAASVRLTPTSDGIEEPVELRRTDGSSMYEVAGSALYSSTELLAAEKRLVDAAGIRDRHPANAAAVEMALLEQAANGTTLNPGQAALVRGMATSGARLQLAIAPAGAGKTTAMRALTAAWVEDGGTVIGLAPSAAAAAVLREQTGASTDTLAKLTWSISHHDLPDWAEAIGPRTLVIIDEAGMADTLSLDTAVAFVTARGGQVRLVGDNQQLAAIGAGGVLRDIAATHGALHLDELIRFTDPVEGAASLALRHGRTEALGFYLDHDRVHVGDLATITHDVFTAWADDRQHGMDTLMLAPTRDLVSQLNQHAQTHRLAGRTPGPGVRLADGNTAHVGDTVVTRANDRRLRVSANDWVKNGDRWTVHHVHPDGSLAVQHQRSSRPVTLPPEYAASAVELGYASTIHGAQGISVTTVHGLATGEETRQQLYTMLTRGAHANHLYLQVVGDGDAHTVLHPDNVHPPTATDILHTILARDDTPISATTTQREQASAAIRLGNATARYLDALHVAAEHHLGATAIAKLEAGAERLLPGISNVHAWPTLRAHLILLAATGTKPLQALHFAASARELDSADDRAAVLDWRLPDPTTTGAGPLPWLPGIPQSLRQDQHWGTYLTARTQLITALATDVRQQAVSTAGPPSWWPPGRSLPTPELLGELAVWRAANNIPDTDHRPTGPAQPAKSKALWQRDLDGRLGNTHAGSLADWTALLHTLVPATRHDDYTPQLARNIADLARTGVDADGLVRIATGAPLPDDHAASALWWRITRHLTLAADQPSTTQHQPTRPDSDVAAELAAAALYRQSMGVLEPTDAQIERMVGRAAAWDDAVAGPQRLAEINAMAMQFYADRVDSGWAGPYLDQRLPGWRTHPHITAGYAPPGWTALVDHLGGCGVTDDELLEVGLATRARTGALIDTFRDRAVLPITHDQRILGLVGRRHPDLTDSDEHAGPKYLNTADTVLFHKGAQLYGAIPDLLRNGATPVLVEGPFDALAVTLASDGDHVGVALLGTALTDEQARQLATLTTSPIVATDADQAGRAAAERDFWLLAQHGTNPRTAQLPPGADPASLLTAAGPAALRDHLRAAKPLGEALLNDLLNVPHNDTTIEAAVELISAQPPQAWTSQASFLTQQLRLDPTHLTEQLLGRVQAWNDDPAGEAAKTLAGTTRPATMTPETQTTAWAQLAERIDPRLTSQPDWPALANMLTLLHDGGTDVPPLVRRALAHGPLDNMPAGDLRYRLASIHQSRSNHYEEPEPTPKRTHPEHQHQPVRTRDTGPSPGFSR